MFHIKEYLDTKRVLVEKALSNLLPPCEGPLNQHLESLNYSLLAGGKRVRPILCIAAAETFGNRTDEQLLVPCALECIHTYSLIHDDLPAMDNDDLRRGKPTNHMVFGEAGAILAGDGLLSFAFELLSSPELSRTMTVAEQLRIIQLIAKAIGSLGMVGGQALDIESEEKTISFDSLQMIHRCKTGALITAAIQSGAIIGQASPSEFQALTSFGDNIGLAFQIVDDLLNVEGTTEQLGKTAGSDADRKKATYPAFFGVEKTRTMAKETIEAALADINNFDHHADPLRQLAEYIFSRTC